MKKSAVKKHIFTIGHSTHPIDEFVQILKKYKIQLLVDIRSIPRSRYVPQFNKENLSTALLKEGIDYFYLKGLGGLRPVKKDSINQGWRTQAFRGFADYMQTKEFDEALELLIEKASMQTVALMCAEAVPWRCHRSLIGDALLVRGFAVSDIMGMNATREHELTPWAKVDGLQVTYPG